MYHHGKVMLNENVHDNYFLVDIVVHELYYHISVALINEMPGFCIIFISAQTKQLYVLHQQRAEYLVSADSETCPPQETVGDISETPVLNVLEEFV